MKTPEQITALEALQGRLRAQKFRESKTERRDVCGEIAAQLAPVGLHDGAMQAADILSRDGFSSQMYESMFSRLDMLVTSGIRLLKSHATGPQAHGAREQGRKVFIGHGRSPAWRELKDFIADRLGLAWEEFNRVPVAGVANTARLAEMLDESCFAFLVMTAEDQTKDGKYHPRLNVVHEAGLFQGRLGFKKAIIVLEGGCEDFSNVEGLGQIRFPAGNIKACFEEVRAVLEREKVLAAVAHSS